MTRLDVTNGIEEDIDIEEKQDISKQKRVVVTPIVDWMIFMIMAKER